MSALPASIAPIGGSGGHASLNGGVASSRPSSYSYYGINSVTLVVFAFQIRTVGLSIERARLFLLWNL